MEPITAEQFIQTLWNEPDDQLGTNHRLVERFLQHHAPAFLRACHETPAILLEHPRDHFRSIMDQPLTRATLAQARSVYARFCYAHGYATALIENVGWHRPLTDEIARAVHRLPAEFFEIHETYGDNPLTDEDLEDLGCNDSVRAVAELTLNDLLHLQPSLVIVRYERELTFYSPR